MKSRGLGDVYKRQDKGIFPEFNPEVDETYQERCLLLIGPVQAPVVVDCVSCNLMRIPMAYKPSPAQPPSALLRQVRPLRLLLNQAERLEHLQRILYKVQPPLVPARRGGNVTTLSNTAAESIRGSAEGISDPRLREALQRLASHAKGKS